ncbi:hypothetical protein PC116_g13067 [Phytophthora cactorum]|uniref:Uncharacterized protein n=1 Tax=Phytophthora cactorum TaxID=29920 RepID=A0A8T0Y8E8_9STRA|nr:hypothetical protein PC111_g17603 [Phytophthora cactorum]KAG2844169.1 hypothetical protein PC113_g18451 [Phytophthora cactorum]KAG2988258.1 hypothetical protein PC119_g19516 [Phytophthora cactorum]KAG4238878.1 hypothetical protein PC116_g13067 [Phytophthora cactorum]
MIKIRLFPTRKQKEKLDQISAAQRAIYNDDEGIRAEVRSHFEAGNNWRVLSNKRELERHKEVQDEVRDSANRDFIKTTKSSIAGFFAVLKRDEKTTYPDMKFKSKFAPSNSIEIPRDISR